MASPPGVELVRESVYEFHKPGGDQRIEVEIVFMHGLQVNASGIFESAYYKTWTTRDGQEVWAEKWLKERYKNARILSLCYNSSARKTSRAGNMSPYTLSESLLEDMVSSAAKIGQNDCPVIFVCHSLGGLIAKEIVVRCGNKQGEQYEKLLRNIKAFFFYATPHQGSDLADSTLSTLIESIPGVNTSTLVKYLIPKETSRSQTQAAFLNTLGDRECKFHVVAEGQKTKRSGFKAWVVRENSARFPGRSDHYTLQHADHFTVCKPENECDGGYLELIRCIDGVVKEYLSRIEVPLSVDPIGIECKLAEIQLGCEDPEVSVIGIFGMGGAGKTTLSRKFYNDNARHYSKSCYLENVASKRIQDVLKEFLQPLCGGKSDPCDRVEQGHLDKIKECLRTQTTLVVIDDVASKDYLEELQVLHALWSESGWKCKVILTGRDKGILPKRFIDSGRATIVTMDGINDGTNAMALFCKHAFAAVGEEARKMAVMEEFQEEAKRVVRLCNGLPLSLEVIGTYLGDVYDEDLDRWRVKWNEAYDRLHEAKSIDGTENDRLWARLRISYDTLGDDEKKMFLECACILDSRVFDRKICEQIWGSSIGIEHLLNRHLLKIRKESVYHYLKVYDGSHYLGDFVMHDQLRDMGRMIGRKGVSKDDPGVYLWEKDKIMQLCESDKSKSTTKVLGLLFDDPRERTDSSQVTSVQSSCDYSQLRLLALRGCHTPLVDDCVSKCSTELRLFHLWNSSLTAVGMHNLCSLKGLRVLWIEWYDIPAAIGELVNLVVMKLEYCAKLRVLPDTIGNLKKLEELRIISCWELERIPDAVGELSGLKRLFLSHLYHLRRLPDTIGNLKNLEDLRIRSCYELEAIPNAIGELSRLKFLEVLWCSNFRSLPDTIDNLKELRRITGFHRNEGGLLVKDEDFSLEDLLSSWKPANLNSE